MRKLITQFQIIGVLNYFNYIHKVIIYTAFRAAKKLEILEKPGI